MDGINAYTCQCQYGYTGVKCETSNLLIFPFTITKCSKIKSHKNTILNILKLINIIF